MKKHSALLQGMIQFAIAANEKLILKQFDVKTAFLYGNLEDQIYIKQSEGFQNHTKFVWKLKKSLWT